MRDILYYLLIGGIVGASTLTLSRKGNCPCDRLMTYL
jgi:hypothetical protein